MWALIHRIVTVGGIISMGRLKDKVVLITGIGSVGPGWGNGKAMAVLFAREGARIYGCDINLSAAEETKSIIDGEGHECTVQEVDVSKSDQVENMIAKCVDRFGGIDILVNNVGISSSGGPVETSEEEWDRVNAVNIKSQFLTCKYVIPHMEKKGKGSIVNISSVAAIRCGARAHVAYNASKSASLGLTQGIAVQYARKQIRCNAIIIGLLDTPIYLAPYKQDHGDDLEKIKAFRNSLIPMGKMGDAWDTAYAALFLASDESKFITGTSLVVDGGMSRSFGKVMLGS